MNLETLRHSCSHIMASCVKKLYPFAKLGIGPSIENGFYYDFEIPQGLKEEDLVKIEELMKEEINKNYPFIQEVWKSSDAIEFFSKRNETYKVELIKELNQEQVSIYRHNDFVDLCKGPHLNSTSEVKYFKLLSISGAYWKGDQNNPQLIRIYGTAFFSKEELDNYINILEESKKRDHRLLGRELKLFDIYYNEAGAGLVFYLPNGAILRRIIEDWEIKEHIKRGYKIVNTPHIMEKRLWQISGHLDYYKDFMYPIIKENQEFILKPMNCPGHILIYKSELRSYRDLPLRFFELGTVYRFEKSGVLHGLLRTRGFTQDDAHIFCKKEDLYLEIENVLDFIKEAMKKFGFSNFNAELSTRPQSYIGQKEDWDMAENILEEILKKQKFNYKINKGDGAFYGPKIDIKLKDALQREWQCATVQLDYNIPKRFNLIYKAQDGKQEQPIMIHRVILGSLERFIATLIEHYAGKFPLWLAPVQISIVNITEKTKDYALKIKEILDTNDFRVDLDLRNETLEKKIREKELLKIPYIVIIGKKEKEKETISARRRGMENLGELKIEEFLKILKKEL